MDKQLRENVKKIIHKHFKAVDQNISDEFIDQIELQLYTQFPNSCDYSKKLITLLTFVEPNGVYGQFANTFREKLIKGVYTPDALIKLDIPDFLPEIFNNPDIELSTKLELNQRIYKDIENHYFIKNKNDKEIMIDDLCQNSEWTDKQIDVIVCKQKNRFYCLHVDKLMEQMKNNKTVTNYINNEPLSVEIINNLQRKYEIISEDSTTSDSSNDGSGDRSDEGSGDGSNDGSNDGSGDGSEEEIIVVKTGQNDKIKKLVMTNESVIRELYTNYNKRLRIIIDIIVDRLKKSNNANERQELNDKLEDTRQQLEKLRESAKTIDGLIILLESALDNANKQLLKMSNITIMDIIYPGEESINQPEKIKLEKNIERYTNEITRLANLKNVDNI